MCYEKRSANCKSTEKQLQFLAEEVSLHSKIIKQVVKLQASFKSLSRNFKCSLGHIHCKIDHKRFNYVNSLAQQPHLKTDARKFKVKTTVSKSADTVFIARMVNKIDQVQFRYGIPPLDKHSTFVSEELQSIWTNSNLLVVDNFNKELNEEITYCKARSERNQHKKPFTRVWLRPSPIFFPRPLFHKKVVQISSYKSESYPQNSDPSSGDVCDTESCSGPYSSQSSDPKDDTTDLDTVSDNDDIAPKVFAESDEDGYAWDNTGITLNEHSYDSYIFENSGWVSDELDQYSFYNSELQNPLNEETSSHSSWIDRPDGYYYVKEVDMKPEIFPYEVDVAEEPNCLEYFVETNNCDNLSHISEDLKEEMDCLEYEVDANNCHEVFTCNDLDLLEPGCSYDGMVYDDSHGEACFGEDVCYDFSTAGLSCEDSFYYSD